MKAIRIHTRSGPEAFVYEDAPQPHPGEGEVLVRIYATSVMWQEPTRAETWKTPMGVNRHLPIPGHDLSGLVAEVGTGVSEVAIGEAVYALTEFWRDGAAAEYAIARATDLASKPRSLDYVQAAGVPLVGLTAWQALFDHARLSAGQSVLITGQQAASEAWPSSWPTGSAPMSSGRPRYATGTSCVDWVPTRASIIRPPASRICFTTSISSSTPSAATRWSGPGAS